MRHICLYISDPNFSCGLTDGLTEVFQEALADLKIRCKTLVRDFLANVAENIKRAQRIGSSIF